MYPTNGE
jgi:hypothetical protein